MTTMPTLHETPEILEAFAYLRELRKSGTVSIHGIPVTQRLYTLLRKTREEFDDGGADDQKLNAL